MSAKRRVVIAAKRFLTLLGILAVCLAAALPLFATERLREGVPPPHAVWVRPEALRSAMDQVSRQDAWRVVMKSDGIELRDYRNRLVSRDALQRELRAGAREVAREAAGLSKLAKLEALLAFLERPDLIAATLRGEAPAGKRRDAVSALAPARSPKVRPSAVQAVGRAPQGPAVPVLSPLQFSLTPGRVRVQALLL